MKTSPSPMVSSKMPRRTRRSDRSPRKIWVAAALTLALLGCTALIPAGHSDEPFARSRQYDLQNAHIELRFDFDQRKVMGQVTHTLAALRDGLRQLDFDSVELTISSVRVNGKDARFTTDATALHVDLDSPSKAGQTYEVQIAYEGKPKQGLYFVSPDASYPTQAKEVWTQGEAEDTRYYLPIYDYPNDRITWDMVLTVPRDWVTISNGKLASVTDAPGEMKTWTWRQPLPVSTYLISLVAGEFDQVAGTWKGIPLEYSVPRGNRERIAPSFTHTGDMLSFFSDRFGVPYPWEKYDQTAVDDFVVGGMENVSATTLTERGMENPVLFKESLQGADGLTSHEMSHQWFGDYVTCKDWADLWLNEGFATFAATLWEEHAYGPDNAAYSRWRDQATWLRQARLFNVPIVTRDFDDSMAYAGNIYGKAGLVIQMLRLQLGDEAFFHSLQHYLETNKLNNVVTADLVKAIEETTHTNVDRFFDQWIYGAGAPRFVVTSTYDAGASKLTLNVKQTQKAEGRIGLFDVPLVVTIGTAKGTKDFPIRVSKAEEDFPFVVDGEPLMVLFDKGDTVLKSVDFHKSAANWVYQLQHATEVTDRADAAFNLGGAKDDPAVAAALGEASSSDKFWGVRAEALRALGKIGGKDAEQQILQSLDNKEPWVREVGVEQLGMFKNDNSLGDRLVEIARNDAAYRVRNMALASLAQAKLSGAFDTLEASAKLDSPDDTIRRAALRGMGRLGDDKAVKTLLEWSVQGKPINVRGAAINSLGQIDKKNKNIEMRLLSYLDDPNSDIRGATVFALGDRDDSAAIAPLEALMQKPDTSKEFATSIKRTIDRLKHVTPPPATPAA